MNCPKCSVSIPNDSVFCPTCGCNIKETEKQIKIEQALEVIQSPEVNSNATTVEVKKANQLKCSPFCLSFQLFVAVYLAILLILFTINLWTTTNKLAITLHK